MKFHQRSISLVLACMALFLTTKATAQAPQRMSYQSVIRNNSNALLANTVVGIKISVLQGSATGTAVYEETQTATTNANGLLSLQIGLGTATTGTFASIDWAAGPYFIKTETDPAGGSNYSITGTQEMLSVPYAMYAAKSGDTATTWSQNGNAGTQEGTNFIGTTDEIPFSIRVNNQPAGYIDYLEDYGSTSLGYQAGNTPTVDGYHAERNTAIGYKALYSNSSGTQNTAVGYRSLHFNETGFWNTAVGTQALLNNSNGNDNTAIGFNSLVVNSTGFRNTANGSSALGRNTTGARNVAMGYFSLRNNTTGIKNVAIGESSLLVNTTGSQNTALGSEADVVTNALTNATAIGYGAKVNASNKIQLGNSSVTDVNTSGTYTAAGFKTPAGTSSQYLMADGSTSAGTVATTMVAVGALSSANGGTITSGVLSLTPADATNGGIVTNAAQTFAGAKTFADDLKASQNIISGTPGWTTDGKIQSWNTNYNGRVLSVIGNNANYTGAAATFWNQGSGPSVAFDYAGSGQKIISFQNQGNEVASVKTNGAINANSFVKTNGTSSQYLMADGSTSAVQVNTCDLCQAIAALQTQITTMQTQITSLNNILTNQLVVGDSYEGGIIVYIFQSGDPGYVARETHGLIAAPSDQSGGIPWSNGLSGIETGATGFNIGAGRSNTDLIIAIQGPISTSYAAGQARAYNGGGFTDWFLPSIEEFRKLAINRSIIGLNGSYWTSTETNGANGEFAWYWGIGDGGFNANYKDAQYNVRAVRTF